MFFIWSNSVLLMRPLVFKPEHRAEPPEGLFTHKLAGPPFQWPSQGLGWSPLLCMMQTCLPVPHKFHLKCVQSSGIDWNSRLFKPSSEVWGFGMGLPSVLHSAQRGLLRVTRMPMAVPAFPRLPHLGQEWIRGLVTGLYRNPHPVTGAPQEVLVGWSFLPTLYLVIISAGKTWGR